MGKLPLETWQFPSKRRKSRGGSGSPNKKRLEGAPQPGGAVGALQRHAGRSGAGDAPRGAAPPAGHSAGGWVGGWAGGRAGLGCSGT